MPGGGEACFFFFFFLLVWKLLQFLLRHAFAIYDMMESQRTQTYKNTRRKTSISAMSDRQPEMKKQAPWKNAQFIHSDDRLRCEEKEKKSSSRGQSRERMPQPFATFPASVT